MSFKNVAAGTTTTSSRKRGRSVETEGWLLGDEKELNTLNNSGGDAAEADGSNLSEEDPLQEVESIYNYYLVQESLPWWRRKHSPMVQSIIVNPPWKEIIRAVCFLCVGAGLVTFGLLIYYGLFHLQSSSFHFVFISFCFFFPHDNRQGIFHGASCWHHDDHCW